MSEIERLFSSLVNKAPVGIFRADVQGHLLFANDALLQMAGADTHALSAESWLERHHPDDRWQILRTWDEMRSGSLTAEPITYRLIKPDGNVTWAHARIIPSLDDAGRLEGYLGVVTDITSEREFRIKAEQLARLYATQSRANAICAHAVDRDALLADLCAQIAEVGGFDYVGVEAADWDNRQIVIAHQAGRIEIHPDNRRFDIDDPAQTNPGKLVLLKEARLVFNDINVAANVAKPVRRAAKALGVASVCGVPIREGGRVVAALIIVATEAHFFTDEIVALIDEIGRAVSAALDSLERSRQKELAEKALARSERLFSTLVEQAPVGVLQIDHEGNAVYANEAMRALVGVGRDDNLMASWFAHVHPDERDVTNAYWARMKEGAGFVQLRYRLVRDDGSIVSIQAQGLPIPDGRGKESGYLVVATDISIEARLRAQAEQLSRLYATLSRVNSIIVQASEEEELYREVCQAIVTSGRFAWAAYAAVDWDRRWLSQGHGCGKDLIPMPYVERDIDDPDLQSIANVAVLTGELAIFNDMLNDNRLSARIREMTRGTDLRSAAAVPVRRAGRVVGALSIVSTEAGFFTDAAAGLLDEIGRDLSFALDNLDGAQRQREAEAAVVRSEQHLNITLRSIGDAVLVTDRAGRVTLMNPVAEALTGWREAEAIGREVGEVFRIISEETREPANSPVEDVLKKGVIVGLANHTLLIAKDGSERPIADSGAPIRIGEDDEIDGVVLVFRDQSEEYQLQQALRESERLHVTIAENVPVGIYLADKDGALRYANERFLEILEIGEDQLSIDAATAVVHPEDRAVMAGKWHAAIEKRLATDFGAYRYLYGDGSIRWVLGKVTPVFDRQGQLSCFTGVVQDITREREHTEHIERLSRFNATVSQINAAIVECRSEAALYAAVTRIAVDVGKFDMANVCTFDADSGLYALPAIASAPVMEPLAAYVRRAIGEQQVSPATAETFASGRRVLFNDLLTDPKLSQQQKGFSRSVGLASVVSVPLSRFGKVVAVILLSSGSPNYFSDDILTLLDEITFGLSHALENIELERERERVEGELARNEERLRLGLSVHNIGLFEVDYRSGMVTFDAVCVRIMGMGDMAITCDLDTAYGQSTANEKLKLFAWHDELYKGLRSSYTAESPLHQPDGSTRWVRHHGVVTSERSTDGRPVRLLGVMSDVTASRSLEERDRLAAKVFENSSEAILILDAERRVLMANQASIRISGYGADEILGLDAHLFRSNLHLPEFYEALFRSLRERGAWQGEMWRKRKNGEVYPALVTISELRDSEGAPVHIIVQMIDISAQKEFEQQIRHLAYRDGLTDLPNRTLLRDRVEQNIASAVRDGGSLALLFLDLDHFKNINDSLGHAIGDRLLKETALRLTASTRDVDTVGRLGGDEFLVLLPEGDADAAAHVAQKLLEECSRPFHADSHSLTVTPSIGIALYPRDGINFDELLKSADTAMYRAKDEGRNAYRFYTPEMNQAVFQRMMLESSLRRAIVGNEFVLHYQPKFELATRRLVGVEALIRWRQPEMGMISPAQFIPVAEESGLIEPIGKWVLQEACRQAKAWRQAGLPPFHVAINISARQFAAKGFVDLVSQTLVTTGVSGEVLELEITESLLAQDMAHTLEVLLALKQLGVRVAVDDFGTGYSSLSYLKRFPIDRLKIDQSFVRDLDSDADDRAIATAVVTMGHSLGMQVIAEGVETAQQMEILTEMGCDEVQGYFLGRPISAAEMTQALRAYQAMFVTKNSQTLPRENALAQQCCASARVRSGEP